MSPTTATIIGVVGTLVGAGLGAYLNKVWSAEPALIEQRRQNDQLTKDREDAQKRAEAAEKQNADMLQKWKIAHYIFANKVNEAIHDATKIYERGQQRPTNQYLAGKIVEARDQLLDQIAQINGSLQLVSDSLDSTITALQNELKRRPVDEKRLTELLNRLQTEWPSKDKIIDANVVSLLKLLGCPSNP